MVGIVRDIAKRFSNAALGIGFVVYRDFGDVQQQSEVCRDVTSRAVP